MRKLLHYTLATYIKEILKAINIVEIVKFETKKILLLVLNIREKCDRRNNSRVARIDNKGYYSNNEFNYNYNLKYITCKHRRRHLYTNYSGYIILNMSQGILPKCSKIILSEVF